MDTQWLLGFIEGSGCFSIIIRKSNNHVGYQTIADFTLKLPRSQKPLLENIKAVLGIGKIYENNDEAILKSTKQEDAQRLVEFFQKKQFVSEGKRREFGVWKQCVEKMNAGTHLTKEGVLQIAHLRDSVRLKNLWNKKNYCTIRRELDPCHVFEATNQLPEGCRICWGTEIKQQLINIQIKEGG